MQVQSQTIITRKDSIVYGTHRFDSLQRRWLLERLENLETVAEETFSKMDTNLDTVSLSKLIGYLELYKEVAGEILKLKRLLEIDDKRIWDKISDRIKKEAAVPNRGSPLPMGL